MTMITGEKILNDGLIQNGSRDNLKHSTYDLTVGRIFKVGQDPSKEESPSVYFLKPREIVWILSNEEFKMPKNVTGLATLRTTYTKVGVLALNVGIIDPLFTGPISTALINFSDRPRRIDVGEKFFRVAFFEHDDVSMYHPRDENIHRDEYISNLETTSFTEFSQNFMNIPSLEDEYYYNKFWQFLWRADLAPNVGPA
jgi:deoxycytidine triphosphate deaminase